jgi:CRP/FNR family cyclic AMP-dependent transcriptional regulator
MYNSRVAVSTERLQAVPLFSELSRKDLQSLAGTMRERTYKAGEPVTEEGEGGIGFFVIDEGEAEVSVEGRSRRVLGPGDHFGEVALLTGSPRTATIVATTDLHCFGLTSWQFKPLVQADAQIAWKLLQGLAAMLSAHDF